VIQLRRSRSRPAQRASRGRELAPPAERADDEQQVGRIGAAISSTHAARPPKRALSRSMRPLAHLSRRDGPRAAPTGVFLRYCRSAARR